MNSDQLLERRINTFLATVVAFFTVALWLSVHEIRNNMNEAAKQDSVSAMIGRIKSLQEQVSLIASDYNNWTDVYEAVEAQSIDKIASNYGITAVRGDVFEYAGMFNGPFIEPIAWIAGGDLRPQEIFLPEETLRSISMNVGRLNAKERETFDFFAKIQGKIVILSASYMLPELSHLVKGPDSTTAIAVIGKVLTQEKLSDIQQELAVSHLEFSESAASTDSASVRLLGAGDEPVGLISWTPPTPGTQLYEKLFGIFLTTNVAFGAVVLFGARMIHRMTTELVAKQVEANSLARTDVLTGLPNRLAFSEKIDSLSRMSVTDLLIVVVDVDRFKQVNDLIGHSAGDAYLVSLASRLRSLENPNVFVARIGGDEFVAIFYGDEATRLVDVSDPAHFLDVLSGPISCESHALDVHVSKGVASSRPGGIGPEEVLRRADRAMYYAKEKGVRDCVWYDEAMEAEDRCNFEIEAALRASVKTGNEFFLVYQPIVSATNIRSVARAEALARWNSIRLGSVSPSDFIRVAESCGLINDLGWIVLDRVCHDLVVFPELNVCVNVSPAQLMTPGFGNEFRRRVADFNIETTRIEIEITENVALVDDTLVSAELRNLSDAGFGISLDDFGTGFASLSYINRMPLRSIKIDRSFVSGYMKGGPSDALIGAIISMAHSIGVVVVAEGVETSIQLRMLLEKGCDFIQGYHTGRPVPLDMLAETFNLVRRVSSACDFSRTENGNSPQG